MSIDPNDYQKHLILFVDDEDKTRKYFSRLFGQTFRIITASDGVEALEVLRQNLNEIGVVVTDQRMPNETGTAFLEKAVKLKPKLVRLLSTAFADIEAAIDAVNKGGVYRYVTKPWDIADLEVTLKRAMEYYIIQNERDDLLKQKVAGIEGLAVADRILSLAALAAARDNKLRYVSEGLTALVQLHAAGQQRQLEPRDHPLAQSHVSWQELYRRHHSFLNRAFTLMPAGISSAARLSDAQASPISAGLKGALGKDAQITVDIANSSGASWPGPSAAQQELIAALFKGITGVLNPTDQLRVQETSSGVEVLMPSGAVCHALNPLFGSTDGIPTDACFGLVAAFLRFSHFGGTIETLPQPEALTVRLRIGFAASRLPGSEVDSIESIAGDLIGNELFWARNFG
jgi:FixJ family two-component response regulator